VGGFKLHLIAGLPPGSFCVRQDCQGYVEITDLLAVRIVKLLQAPEDKR